MTLQQKIERIHKALNIIDTHQRDTVIVGYYDDYISICASRFKNNYKNIDVDDLIQIGRLGLMNALKNYNGDPNTFSSFADKYIKGYIANSITNGTPTFNLTHTILDDNVKQLEEPYNNTYDDLFNTSDFNYILEIAKEVLNKIEYSYIVDYYVNHLTLNQISKKYNKNFQNIHKIKLEAINKIKASI